MQKWIANVSFLIFLLTINYKTDQLVGFMILIWGFTYENCSFNEASSK